MANKFYQVKKEINGTEYVAQFNGLNAALELQDRCYLDGGDRISNAKLAKEVLTNVIVDPANLTADDFDDMDALNEVVSFGRDVLWGELKTPSEPEREEGQG